jgi:LmbE family N-acetylglucosaminyl deacetylase
MSNAPPSPPIFPPTSPGDADRPRIDPAPEPASRIVARPHWRLVDDGLVFLCSRRPHRLLSAEEAALWQAIRNSPTLAELRQQFGSAVGEKLVDWHAAGLCEFIESQFRANRRRILVIEPHADDAALSVGGTLWQWRHDFEFTVATMASRSNFTSYYYLDRPYFSIETVGAIRSAESELFSRLIGGRQIDVGLTDAALRYHDTDWSHAFFRAHRGAIAAATARQANAAERRRWADAARALLALPGFEEVWIPQGSPHGDHRLASEACLAALVDKPALLAGRRLRVYQDVPYAARYPAYSAQATVGLHRAGFSPVAETSAIGEALLAKLRLVSVYASQFKMAAMADDILASAREGKDSGPVERFWTLRSLPAAQSNWQDHLAGDAGPRGPARDWFRRNTGCAALRILLLVPTGAWQEDLERLRSAFPRARFTVHAAPAAIAEVRAAEAGLNAAARPAVETVGAGQRAWIALALRLALASPAPTLFVVGDRRRREAGWLAGLWPRSDTLVVASIDELHAATGEPVDAERIAA